MSESLEARVAELEALAIQFIGAITVLGGIAAQVLADACLGEPDPHKWADTLIDYRVDKIRIAQGLKEPDDRHTKMVDEGVMHLERLRKEVHHEIDATLRAAGKK